MKNLKIYTGLFSSILFSILFSSCSDVKNNADLENDQHQRDLMNHGAEDEREPMHEERGEDGMMHRGMMHHGMMHADTMMSEDMRRAMMSGGMGPEMMEDMMLIRELLFEHQKISRRVENLKNGVKTWTTSEDPALVTVLQKHVRQMKERIEKKQPIRHMDPLFRELFENSEHIEMKIEDIENGITVIETSKDPWTVKLMQQHAKTVSEFIEQGMQRAMQPSPLPDGYKE